MIALPERVKRENETPVMRRCLVALNRLPRIRAVRNNNGKLEDKTGRWVTFGLGDGSPDIQCRVEIGGVRDSLPCVFWIEVKSPTGRTSRKRAELQKAFVLEAASRGELSATVTTELDAILAAERIRTEYERRAAVRG